MNKKNQSANFQLSPFRELLSAWPCRQPHPQACPPSGHAPCPVAPPLRGLASPQALTHLPSSASAQRWGSAHPPRRAKRGERSRESFPPTLPLPHPTLWLTCRPDPGGKQAFSLTSCGLSLTGWSAPARAASAVWAVAEKTPPPGFCGLQVWLCPVLVFCFVWLFWNFPAVARQWSSARARPFPQCTLGPGERRRAPSRHRGKIATTLALLGAGASSGSAGSWPGPVRSRICGGSGGCVSFPGIAGRVTAGN